MAREQIGFEPRASHEPPIPSSSYSESPSSSLRLPFPESERGRVTSSGQKSRPNGLHDSPQLVPGFL
jgi:hypothetical protein